MAWSHRGERKGARRLPEPLRLKVIGRDRSRRKGCHFAFSDICLGIDQKLVEVHHLVDAEDGGSDDEVNLVTACKPCHTRHSAQVSQKRSVAKQVEWKRQPERRPNAD